MTMKTYIRKYEETDEEELFALIQSEGDEWLDYWSEEGRKNYKKAIKHSGVILIFENEKLCGYLRYKDDDGFGIYIYDLLVDIKSRGKQYGKLLMNHVKEQFPQDDVYVMSDVDIYYEKLGYEKEGTIFIL